MLIIINSMPKSGSTWFHNYVMRCLCRLGYPTPHQAVAGWPVLLNQRANPGAVAGTVLDGLLAAARGQTFAIKAHVPPNAELAAALARQEARMIFLVRHPADIVRSALAYGEFCRAARWDEPYRDLHDPQEAADFIAPGIEWAAGWLTGGCRAAVSRYEELFAGDLAIRVAAHRLEPAVAAISQRVLDEMRPSALSLEERRWLRVNLRRRPELDAETALRCEEWARRLGYAPRREAA